MKHTATSFQILNHIQSPKVRQRTRRYATPLRTSKRINRELSVESEVTISASTIFKVNPMSLTGECICMSVQVVEWFKRICWSRLHKARRRQTSTQFSKWNETSGLAPPSICNVATAAMVRPRLTFTGPQRLSLLSSETSENLQFSDRSHLSVVH